jgi:hypothetical protein
MSSWVGFRYREFHDVPRLIVFDHEGRTYLLDCSFDHVLDEYPDTYRVLELSCCSAGPVQDWDELARTATRDLGRVPVTAVRFDETRRREIDVTTIPGLASGVARGSE